MGNFYSFNFLVYFANYFSYLIESHWLWGEDKNFSGSKSGIDFLPSHIILCFWWNLKHVKNLSKHNKHGRTTWFKSQYLPIFFTLILKVWGLFFLLLSKLTFSVVFPSFHQKNFSTENIHFSNAVFSFSIFQNLRMSRKLRVAGFFSDLCHRI